MPSTLIPADLIERQSATTDAAVDAAGQLFQAQRSMLEAALETVRLTIEAIAHLTRSVASTALELSVSGVTTSTRSVEQLSRNLTIAAEPANDKTNSSGRKTKDAIAA